MANLCSRCREIIRFTGSTELAEVMAPPRIQPARFTGRDPLYSIERGWRGGIRKRLLRPFVLCSLSLLGSYAICRAACHVFHPSRGGVGPREARKGWSHGDEGLRHRHNRWTLSLRPMNHGRPPRLDGLGRHTAVVPARSIDATPLTRHGTIRFILSSCRSNACPWVFREKLMYSGYLWSSDGFVSLGWLLMLIEDVVDFSGDCWRL